MHVRLDDIVSENFRKIFYWIMECQHYLYVLKGGRYSGKSVDVGQAVVMGVMKHKKSAVVMMQYKSDLGAKVVDNFTFCINNLGVEKHWKLKKSPYEYVLLNDDGSESNVSIRFYGCDNIQDTKGFKSRLGEGFKWIWFEEVNRFKSWEVVQSIIDTCDRLPATEKVSVILTYNPPKVGQEWTNVKYKAPVGKSLGYKTDMGKKIFEFVKAGVKKKRETIIHHSTIEDLINSGHADWISDGVYASAMEAKEHNPLFYRWNYLGEVVGSEADVFKNITKWEYNTEDLKDAHNIYRGFDASNGGKDPYRYVEVAYDKVHNDLYILKEFNVAGIGENTEATFDKIAEKFREANKNNILTYGDGAVPNNINMLRIRGCNIVRTKKDLKISGVMWLQGLNHIYVDPKITPFTYDELVGYAYKLDKDDNVTNDLVDGCDHSIDAIRYALVNVIRYDW